MGFQLITLAPDRPAKLRETKERHGIRGRMLSDSQMLAAQAFQVAYRVDADTLSALKKFGVDLEEASGENHHRLPVPAVFIVGTDGVIQFTYANPEYRIRIPTDMLLGVVRALKK